MLFNGLYPRIDIIEYTAICISSFDHFIEQFHLSLLPTSVNHKLHSFTSSCATSFVLPFSYVVSSTNLLPLFHSRIVLAL